MKNLQKRSSQHKQNALMPVRLKQALIGALVCLMLANVIVPFPMLRSKAASLEEPDRVSGTDISGTDVLSEEEEKIVESEAIFAELVADEVAEEEEEDIDVAEEEPAPGEEIVIDYKAGRPLTDEELAAAEAALSKKGLMKDKPINYAKSVDIVKDEANKRKIIPSKYNLADYGRVTEVKDQGYYGTCWAFAAISSAESSLLTDNKAELGSLDLSEKHLAYNAYHKKADRLGNIDNDYAQFYNVRWYWDLGMRYFGYDYLGFNYWNWGGNADIAANTLTCQCGLAEESEWPYPSNSDYGYSGTFTNTYNTRYAYEDNKYVVDQVRAVSLGDRDYVKEQIMKYGAAVISINASSKYINKNTGAICNTKEKTTNHDVSLVGWDDNYSRYNFNSKYRPKKNGAWLIKNSWGTGSFPGDDGYYWVSYEDKSFAGQTYKYSSFDKLVFGDAVRYPSVYFFHATDVNDYNHVYQYDGLSGYDYDNSAYDFVSSDYQTEPNAGYAAVYTAAETETIESVMIGTNQSNKTVRIKIYNYIDNESDPTSGSLVSEQVARIVNGGYSKITLSDPVQISSGDKFSICVYDETNETPGEQESFSVYRDRTIYWLDWDGDVFLSIVSSHNDNECFGYTKADGWYDLGESISIKALTVGDRIAAGSISVYAPSTEDGYYYTGVPYNFTADISPSNSTDDIKWQVSKVNNDYYDEEGEGTDTAVISDGGCVTFLEPGFYNIHAKAGYCSNSVYYIEVRRSVDGMTFKKSTIYTTPGSTVIQDPVFLPEAPDEFNFYYYSDLYDSLEWTSSNTNIAEVNSNGEVYAKAAGKAVIKAVLNDKVAAQYVVSVSATPINTKSIAINPNSLDLVYDYDDDISCELPAEFEASISATVSPVSSTYANVTFENENEDVAVLDMAYAGTGYAYLYASSPGTSRVTARTADGKEAVCDVTVYSDGQYIAAKMAEQVVSGKTYNITADDYYDSFWYTYTPESDCSYSLNTRSKPGAVAYQPFVKTYSLDEEGRAYLIDDPYVPEYAKDLDKWGVGGNKKLYGRMEAGRTYLFEVTLSSPKDSLSVQFDILNSITGVSIAGGIPEDGFSAGFADTVTRGVDSNVWDENNAIILDPSVINGLKLRISDSEGSSEYTVYDGFAGPYPVTVYNNISSDRWRYDCDEIVTYPGVGESKGYFYTNEATKPIDVFAVPRGGSFNFTILVGDCSDLSVDVDVQPFDINDCDVEFDQDYYFYTGGDIEPGVTLSYKAYEYNRPKRYADTVVEAHHEFKVYMYDEDCIKAFENNVGPGAGIATLTGDCELTGTRTETFLIIPEGEMGDDGDYYATTDYDGMLTVDSVTASTAHFAWKNIPGVKSYNVERADVDGDDKYSVIATVSGDVNDYTDHTLKYATSYSYRVSAVIDYPYSDGTELHVTVNSNEVPIVTNMAKPNVTAVSASYNSIKVTWNKIAAATGYYVYRYDADNPEPVLVKKITKAGTVTFTNTALETGKEYFFFVRPYKVIKKVVYPSQDEAELFNSNVVSATPIPATPSAPATTPIVASNAIKVSWKPVAGATAYLVERSTSINSGYSVIADNVPNSKAPYYLDDTVDVESKYYYRVTAYTNVNDVPVYGKYSASISGMLGIQTPVLSLVSATNNTINIKWEKITGAKGYEVWCSVDGASFKKIATIAKGTTVTYKHKKLATGSNYKYQVLAYAPNGNKSEFSNIISKTTTFAAPKVKVSRSGFDLKVSWNSVAGASKYEVYRSVDGKNFTLVTTTKNAKTKKFVDKFTSRGVNYTYKVRAIGKVKGDYSVPVTSTSNLAAPKGITVKASGYNKIIVSWKKSAGATGYDIYRSTDKNGVYRWIGSTSGNKAVKYVDSSIDTGVTYYYVVKAEREIRDKYDNYKRYVGYSNCTALKGATAQLGAPAKLTGKKIGAGTAQLTWKAVANASGYIILRYDPYSKSWIKVDDTERTSYIDESYDLVPGATYQYRVRAYLYDSSEISTEGKLSAVVKVKV